MKNLFMVRHNQYNTSVIIVISIAILVTVRKFKIQLFMRLKDCYIRYIMLQVKIIFENVIQ